MLESFCTVHWTLVGCIGSVTHCVGFGEICKKSINMGERARELCKNRAYWGSRSGTFRMVDLGETRIFQIETIDRSTFGNYLDADFQFILIDINRH